MLRCDQCFNLWLGLKYEITSLILRKHAIMVILIFWDRFQRWQVIHISLEFGRAWAVNSIIISNTNSQRLDRFMLIVRIKTLLVIMLEFICTLFPLGPFLRIDGFTPLLGSFSIKRRPFLGSQLFHGVTPSYISLSFRILTSATSHQPVRDRQRWNLSRRQKFRVTSSQIILELDNWRGVSVFLLLFFLLFLFILLFNLFIMFLHLFLLLLYPFPLFIHFFEKVAELHDFVY